MQKQVRNNYVEILGCLGLILWIGVILIRKYGVPDNALISSIVGFMPNVAAAWFVTLLSKFIIKNVVKKKYTVQIHIAICLAICIIATFSELSSEVLYGSSFDIVDLLATYIAQGIMMYLPQK